MAVQPGMALPVIDMQRDFLDPLGYVAQSGVDVSMLRRTIAPVQRLLAAGVSALTLAGVTTDICVHSTLREAIDRGFDCITVVAAWSA